MKKIVMIVAILSVVTLVATAQTFKTGVDPQVMQSQQIMATGNAYNGTVYKPFDNTTPAEYNPVVGDSPAKAPGGPRRVLPGGTTEPNQSEDSPIGDAVLPLLLLAGAYLIVRATRRRALKR